MDKNKLEKLKSTATEARKIILKMATGPGCFAGSSLSLVDIVTYLYSEYLNINKDNLNNDDRDYVFLSKGHTVPALYSVFVEKGILEKSRIDNNWKTNDDIYLHPNPNIPGIEFHSGSLGHGLGVAIGVALDFKILGKKNKVVVIIGDGELNEGSNWESLLVAASYKLDNLIIIIDKNKIQANKRTEDLIPMEPLDNKFKEFGCAVERGNGHSFAWLDETFNKIPFKKEKPSVIIADTIRGKGVPSIQERVDRWFCSFTQDEAKELEKELMQNA